MERTLLDNTNIRKLIVGDIKEGIPYTIGQKMLKNEQEPAHHVTRIIRDENAKFIFGNVAYLVYVQKEGGPEKIWKMFEGQPVVIEFNTNDISTH